MSETYPIYEPTDDLHGFEPKQIYTAPNEDFTDLTARTATLVSRSTPETMSYLRGQASSGSTAWQGLCLRLQRTARGLPGVYPSAIAAAEATPRDRRVILQSKVVRGMVAYWDDPNDSNPYGHITAVAGRDPNTGELLHWTNDAAGPGRVSLVRHSFFPQYWGDSFLFATDWLNGYDLDMPEKKPALPLAHGAPRIQDAIKRLEKAAAAHREKGHTRLVKALERDITHLHKILSRFGGLE